MTRSKLVNSNREKRFLLSEGFTLIELLGVIILLGIIGLIIYPIVNNSIKDSKEKALAQIVRNLEEIAYSYSIEHSLNADGLPHQLLIEDMQKAGLLKDNDIINPVTNNKLSGCIIYKWKELTKQFSFQYSEDCQLPEYYTDSSGANRPELLDKMIPVKFENNNWVYADIYKEWYDYDKKEWANAVVLKSGVTKSVGQTISESDIGLWYVWIPRYKYTIFNGNNGATSEQEIKVMFENEASKTGTVRCIDSIIAEEMQGNVASETCTDSTNGSIINGTSTYTHPAFTFGEQELAGIWVGKFENSTTDVSCLTTANDKNCNKNTHILEIKPNADSLRYIDVLNVFTSVQYIKTNYNISNGDSHLMKNMEWGAVTYLTQSKYGRCENGVCEEVTINNVSKNRTTYTTQTGCAGNSVSASTSTTCENEYDTIGGVKASTTGNIYGIYDMSGGASDRVMGIMAGCGGSSTSRINSKYYDLYSFDSNFDENLENYNYSTGKLGDATKEILKTLNTAAGGWNNDESGFLNLLNCEYIRGNQSSGIFSFSASLGSMTFPTVSSRSVFVLK